MASPPQLRPRAGGFLLIVALMAGALIGIARGEAMAGALIGLAVGVALALLVWIIDLRR